jgi:hypothetical protein
MSPVSATTVLIDFNCSSLDAIAHSPFVRRNLPLIGPSGKTLFGNALVDRAFRATPSARPMGSGTRDVDRQNRPSRDKSRDPRFAPGASAAATAARRHRRSVAIRERRESTRSGDCRKLSGTAKSFVTM